jgi:hypothetical protein
MTVPTLTDDDDTCTPIARQRVGKQLPRENRFLVNNSLLGHATIEETVFRAHGDIITVDSDHMTCFL